MQLSWTVPRTVARGRWKVTISCTTASTKTTTARRSIRVGGRASKRNLSSIVRQRSLRWGIKPVPGARAGAGATDATAPEDGRGAGGNPFGSQWCTWLAYERRPDIYRTAVAKGGPTSGWNGYQWAARARAAGFAVGSEPAVGAIAVFSREYFGGPKNDGRGGQYGHVAHVTGVNSNGSFNVDERNGTPVTTPNRYARRAGIEFIYGDSAGNGAAQTPPGGGPSGSGPTPVAPGPPGQVAKGNVTSGTAITIPGRWVAGDSGQDFAYATTTSDGGFTIAVWKQTPAGLVWQGNWWTSPGSAGLTLANTVFIPTDADGDGLMDLYYAAATDWTKPGFAVALMRNTGSSFQYVGQQWNPTNLKLSETRFMPGKWSNTGRGAFAYVTKNSDGGFSVASFSATPTGIVWQGVRWSSPGSSGVTYDKTTFFASDQDGNGLSDIYYATAANPSQPGFALGLQYNTGSAFQYAGTQWAPSDLTLSQIRFLPARWTGGSQDDIAYVTPGSDGGFAFAVFQSKPTGLEWKGVWWASSGASGVLYSNTVFSPADSNGDGRTDLHYATSSDWARPGFALARMHNPGSNTTLTYAGQQWNPTNISLGQTLLMPGG